MKDFHFYNFLHRQLWKPVPFSGTSFQLVFSYMKSVAMPTFVQKKKLYSLFIYFIYNAEKPGLLLLFDIIAVVCNKDVNLGIF